MRLLRVQVPEFRALKDVDISFEPEFTPQVFPLGSLNGGGKSTLLQLIFVLLHCSADKQKHQFIANMLDGVTIPKGQSSRLLAKFELLDGDEKIKLDFNLCNDDYLKSLDIDPVFNKEMVSFKSIFEQSDILVQLSEIKKRIKEFENEILNINDLEELPNYQKIENAKERTKLEKLLEELNQNKIKEEKKLENLESLVTHILSSLKKKNQFYIQIGKPPSNLLGLLVDFSIMEDGINAADTLLKKLSKSIFLSAPENQVYLFLKRKVRSILFYSIEEYKRYLKYAKNDLSNFKTYDIFSIDIITSLFEIVRNKDFKILVETGENGTNYKEFINELSLFSDKKINPQLDENSKVIGIIFKNQDGIELSPEDLSHGELKRLSIYAWLKSMPEGENIVLMDEIENGFHPDWQYQIVRDLQAWGETNQYILATHSYELCTAVTPAHVKELEPRLTK